jgi:hypothetical protein
MMTQEQSKIFNKVLETNWEVDQLQVEGKFGEAWQKAEEHNAHVKELKESMGEEAYNNFIDLGREMFAPKKEEPKQPCLHENIYVAVRHESGITLKKCRDCNARV